MVITTRLGCDVVMEVSILNMLAKCRLGLSFRSWIDHEECRLLECLAGICWSGSYEVVLTMFWQMDKACNGYSISSKMFSTSRTVMEKEMDGNGGIGRASQMGSSKARSFSRQQR